MGPVAACCTWRPQPVPLPPVRAGWYVRSDIQLAQAQLHAESVADRPIRSQEYVFLLTAAPRYHHDADTICEPVTFTTVGKGAANAAAICWVTTTQHDATHRDQSRPERSGRQDVALQRLVRDAVLLEAGEIAIDEFRQRADVTLTWLETCD